MLDKIILEGSKILVMGLIDDDVRTLQNIFSPEKYIVGVIAEQTSDVITIIKVSKPDLILLNFHLNGLKLCEQIQQNDKINNIPLIFIADQATPYDIAKGFNAGAIDYINKPFQIEEVKSRIKTNLKNSKLSKELVASRLEAEYILSSIVDCIISINNKGKIVYFNKIAEILFGLNSYNISRFLEMPYIKLSYNDNELSLLDMIESTLLNNNITQIQRGTELINMHGQNYVIKGTIAPMYNDRMQAIGVLITIQDITEQILLEKTLSHAEKITTIGTLAAGFAHEMSNPLAAIVQGIENIKRRVNPNSQSNKDAAKLNNTNMYSICEYMKKRNITQILDGIQEASIRAANITKSIMRLDINKPYLGEKENINTIISNRIIQSTKEKYDVIKLNRIKFAIELDHAVPEVVCIKNDLDLVVLSLLNNAFESIAENNIEKPIIEIKTYCKEKNVYVHISDFGKKISSKVTDHMFDPFYTSTPVRSGLGLFLSYFIIVNKHHGTFLYSYEHKYLKNVFTISLPLS